MRRGIRFELVAGVALTVALAASVAAVWHRAHPAIAIRAVPLATMGPLIEASVPIWPSPRGVEFDVGRPATLLLPFRGVPILELDLTTSAPMVLTYASKLDGRNLIINAAPWRRVELPGGGRSVTLELRATRGWSESARPALLFAGAGNVELTALRVGEAVLDRAAARDDGDRAFFWSGESPTISSVNLIAPPTWSQGGGLPFADRVAIASALAGLLVALLLRWRTGRWVPGPALATTALLVVGLPGAYGALRFLSAWRLTPIEDPEERIRSGYALSPQLGELAVLSRARLGPGDRVGVIGKPEDWSGPQTLCFNVAPRRCAIVREGEEPSRGISGVGRIPTAELDVLVALDVAASPPPGFVEVARVGPGTYIARRP
jgi:hypothetical protein